MMHWGPSVSRLPYAYLHAAKGILAVVRIPPVGKHPHGGRGREGSTTEGVLAISRAPAARVRHDGLGCLRAHLIPRARS